MKIAIYPGTFDPITFGHMDIINRSLNVFDKVIVLIAVNNAKNSLFTPYERKEIIEELFSENDKVNVEVYNGLTVDACKEFGATAIIRGLRMLSDFEYEYSMSLTNKELDKDIESVFFMTSIEYTYLSSTIAKEVFSFGGNVEKFLPELVIKKIKEK